MAQYPELFILRHGQTEWNAAGRIQGHMESVLTDLGREHARAQGRILRDIDLPVGTRFHCSTAIRARQTAALALIGLPGAESVQFDDRLREIGVGECEGLLRSECQQRWPHLFEGDHPAEWIFDAPGGEGFEAFRARITAWLDEQDGPRVVVAHGIVSKVLRGIVLGLDRAASLDLPGGQGMLYHLADGVHRRLDDGTDW